MPELDAYYTPVLLWQGKIETCEYRIVAIHGYLTVERLDRDSLGNPQWSCSGTTIANKLSPVLFAAMMALHEASSLPRD